MADKPYVVKQIEPEGNLLNDNECDNDYLGTTVYAEALARRILNVPTPLTIGVFARWGSGKSFLLKHVQSFLKKFEQQSITGETLQSSKKRQQNKPTNKKSAFGIVCPIIVLLLLVISTIFAFVLVLSPEIVLNQIVEEKVATPTTTNATTTQAAVESKNDVITRRLRIAGAVIVALVLVFSLSMVTFCVDAGSMFKSKAHSAMDCINLLMFAAFTKLPVEEAASSSGVKSHVPEHDIRTNQNLQMNFGVGEITPAKTNRRFIFVNFKAWEYIGSDTLWAGIITNLSDVIEAHFGVVLCRLFRTISLATCSKDPTESKSRKKENFWETLFVNLGEETEIESDELIDNMKEFGVVHGCHKYQEWPKRHLATRGAQRGWYVVEFTQASAAVSACQNLTLRGVQTSLSDPHKPAVPRKKKLGKFENIEMQERGALLGNSPKNEKGDEKPKDKDQRSFCAHHRRYPKTSCLVPTLYWWVLLLTTAVMVPVLTYVVAVMFDLKVFKYPRSVPVGIQIFAWLPGAASASFVLIRFVYAMFNSQRSRVQAAMEGSRGNMKDKLGFMDKVKTEVRTMTRLIKLIEYVNRREYKVVINIDDLDRVPLDKIKSILDAVSILLSDGNSPFICLVAVDSRIAVKCIEGEMGSTLLKANVNGHEYMRKIINLPFCIPEIDDEHKKSFIDGLMDQSDRTTRIMMVKNTKASSFAAPTTQHPTLAEVGRTNTFSTPITNRSDDVDSIREIPTAKNAKSMTPNFGDKNFLFECRRFFYQSSTVHKHLHGVPRNIKRIFNILSITTLMINCYYNKRKKQAFLRNLSEKSRNKQNNGVISQPAGKIMMETNQTEEPSEDNYKEIDVRTKLFAENLVCWIILTDQWPYRISFILQIIEDADQRYLAGKKDQAIHEDMSLLEIYRKHVVPLLHKFKAGHEEASLMSLDHDPDIFFSFLMDLQNDRKPRLTKRTVKLLMKFTVNLDQSLRQNIAYLRSVSDVESCMDAMEPTADVEPEVPEKGNPVKKEDSVDILHPYFYGPGYYGAGLYNAAFDPRMPYSGGNDPRMPYPGSNDPRMPYPGGNQLRPVNSFTAQPSVASQPATSALSPEKSPVEKPPAAVEKPKDAVDGSSKVEEED